MTKKVLVLLMSTALSLVLLEIGSRLVFRAGREGVPATEMFRKDLNKFENAEALLMEENGCSKDDWYLPHPAYDMLFRRDGPCALPRVNQLGFRSDEFPLKPEAGKFRILVLGASVADLLASYSASSHLGQALTKRALGPGGETIEVYSAAVGGWRLPNQEIVFNRFITQFDAVVAIDGYNEFYVVTHHYAGLLTPFSHFMSLSVFTQGSLFASGMYRLYRYLSSLRFRPVFRESVATQALHFLVGTTLNKALEKYRATSELFKMNTVYANINGDDRAPKSDFHDAVLRYSKYSKMIHATSSALGKKSLHVIQPGAFTGKPLVGQELAYSDPETGERYRKFANEVVEALKGYPTFSLLDIFASDGDREVYADPVHYAGDHQGSYGNEKMAEAIAELAIKHWKLKRK